MIWLLLFFPWGMRLYFCAGLVLLRILMYLIMERELTCIKYIKIVIYVNMEMNWYPDMQKLLLISPSMNGKHTLDRVFCRTKVQLYHVEIDLVGVAKRFEFKP